MIFLNSKYEFSKLIVRSQNLVCHQDHLLSHSKYLFLAGGLSPEAPTSVSCFQAATPKDSLSVLVQASVASILGFDLHTLELRHL